MLNTLSTIFCFLFRFGIDTLDSNGLVMFPCHVSSLRIGSIFLLLGRTALCDGPPWNKVSSFVCGAGLKANSIWHNCCVELRLAGAHVE